MGNSATEQDLALFLLKSKVGKSNTAVLEFIDEMEKAGKNPLPTFLKILDAPEYGCLRKYALRGMRLLAQTDDLDHDHAKKLLEAIWLEPRLHQQSEFEFTIEVLAAHEKTRDVIVEFARDLANGKIIQAQEPETRLLKLISIALKETDKSVSKH